MRKEEFTIWSTGLSKGTQRITKYNHISGIKSAKSRRKSKGEFCSKPVAKIDLIWMKGFLFLIAQTQQAATQTAISQMSVRNFPSGSHLLLWKMVAADLWSVRAKKFGFFLSCIRSCPAVTVPVKYWWQLSDVAGGHADSVAGLVLTHIQIN